jgi:hypothetical protein
MQLLRRSDLFVANGSHPAKSPVGAAPSLRMPLLRSFGFLPFAIYKYDAPMGLGKAPLALNSTVLETDPRLRRRVIRGRQNTALDTVPVGG